MLLLIFYVTLALSVSFLCSIMEAVLLIFRTRNFVPVVDPATRRLLGIVSTWDILAKLEGDK